MSKVYLRNAIDWRFPEMIMVASNYGPTVDLDQSSGHGLDFTDCRIIGGGQDGTGNDVCIQISGSPTDDSGPDLPQGGRRQIHPGRELDLRPR